MVTYRCLCNYENHHRADMNKHLRRVNPCLSNLDRQINVDDLLVGTKKMTDLSNLTEDERKAYDIEYNRKYHQKYNSIGSMGVKQLSCVILGSMKCSTTYRNIKCVENKLILHEDIIWTYKDIMTRLENNQIYKIPDTILGNLEFPCILTNGNFNTISPDRIDDNVGYNDINIEWRPRFLNALNRLSTQNIREIIEIRELVQDDQILINNSKICSYIDPYIKHNFFHKLASSAKGRKDDRKSFDFDSIEECAKFLIATFIEQGGRSAYTNAPIIPKKHGGPFMVSIERRDPSKSYCRENIILIESGLNYSPPGQFLNENLTEQQQTDAVNAAIFNHEYWDTCTRITPEIKLKMQKAREHDRDIINKNIITKPVVELTKTQIKRRANRKKTC